MGKARFLFFSGKGGVGKTSMACATAVHLAGQGRRTLIVTTDPASNLADVYEQPIGHKLTPIEGVPGLWAMEMDPDAATAEYKDRALAPLRTLFPDEVVKVMEEQMNSPCTAEVAAFDRFTDFIDQPVSGSERFDVVIFDTAPTGHTLRLLELPAEWSHQIEAAVRSGGQTCIGPAAAIQEQKAKYDRALAALVDPRLTTFTFVLHPEASAIRETKRSIAELKKLGISNFQLIINGVIPDKEASNPFFAKRAEMQRAHMEEIRTGLAYQARVMRLLDHEIKGVDRLRQVGELLFSGGGNGARVGPGTAEEPDESEAKLIGPGFGLGFQGSRQTDDRELEEARDKLTPCRGQRRTIFVAGKGGVGKTVVSCLAAVWLARRGYRTLLLTTDPAEHISDVLETRVTDEPTRYPGLDSLWVTKIDAEAAAAAYRKRILDDARLKGRSAAALAAMEEELNSPCTEEMAAFDKFVDYAAQEGWEAVVFDTAPTGHTLRLLQLPVDWSAQLSVKLFASADSAAADDVAKARFAAVIEMMRDPTRSTFAFVMYPESTPIVEAARAMAELRTVGIEPGLVVANQVIPEEACATAYARARRKMQEGYLEDMRRRFQVPILSVPLQPREIAGYGTIVALVDRVLGNAGVGETANARNGDTIAVRIFGVPVACGKGVSEAWRRVAEQVAAQFRVRFGERVTVEYHDLFSPEIDRFPDVLSAVSQGAEIPLVYVESALVSSGGKVSTPAIVRCVEELLALSPRGYDETTNRTGRMA